jgi:hypothetical protein
MTANDANQLVEQITNEACAEMYDQMQAEQMQADADERESIERAFIEANVNMDKVDTPITSKSKQLIDYQ